MDGKLTIFGLLILVVTCLLINSSGWAQEQGQEEPNQLAVSPIAADRAEAVKDTQNESVEITIDSDDTYVDTNNPPPEPAVSLQGDPNEVSEPISEKIQKYWQIRYHGQVDQRIFMILNYPYYRGGADYPIKDFPDMSVQGVGKDQAKGDSEEKSGKSLEGKQLEQGSGADQSVSPKALGPGATRYALERCCDMIHQWRSINESAGTTLEIVRAVELTRIETNIYRINPQLAVQVKRTVGEIGKINRNFDLTGRMTMQAIIAGNIDKNLMARMKKQLADLKSQLVRLAEQNDQISITLGVGKLDRQSPLANIEPVNFSGINLLGGE